jgi:hypothetical protein
MVLFILAAVYGKDPMLNAFAEDKQAATGAVVRHHSQENNLPMALTSGITTSI